MSLSKTNGIDTILKNNYQNANHWEFEIPGEAAAAKLKFQVKSVTVPYTMLETKTANTGDRYVTGYAPEGEYTISFYDDTAMSIHNYLLNWRVNLFSNSTRIFNLWQRKNMKLWTFSYDAEGNKQYSLEFTFINTLIKGLGPFNFDYDTTGALITTATFISNDIGIKLATGKSVKDKSTIGTDVKESNNSKT